MSLDPQTYLLTLMKQVQPAYRRGADEPLEAWQEKARARLGELLGMARMTPTEPDFRIEWTQQKDGYTETRFLFQSEPETDVCCHLLVPDGAAGKLPFIVCLQGHSRGMHISLGTPMYEGDEKSIAGGRDFARQIVARGQAALAIEQRGFGQRGGTPEPACQQPAVQAMMLGRTLIGERCWDISRALDVALANFPVLDGTRIGIMGNSGGGTATIYAAALDTRFTAAMPSCAFCGYLPSIGAQHHCICNYVPGIMNEFDMSDLAGLIAPRPLVIVNGKEDTIFPLASAQEQAAIARTYYAAANADSAMRHVIGSEGHRFYPVEAWPVFDEVTGWRA